MKKIIGLFLLLSLISFSGCTKSKPDCEVNNFGILKMSYVASSYRHSVVVTGANPAMVREKITAIGVTSDTLHLRPATYDLSVALIDANGAALNLQSGNAVITQCNESSASVSF
jgi:hypothetical protein